MSNNFESTYVNKIYLKFGIVISLKTWSMPELTQIIVCCVVECMKANANEKLAVHVCRK